MLYFTTFDFVMFACCFLETCSLREQVQEKLSGFGGEEIGWDGREGEGRREEE